MKKTGIITALSLGIVLSYVTPNFAVQATATDSPTCVWDNLTVQPYPDPTNWNYTGQFEVKNTSNSPQTYRWFLDDWENDTNDSIGTTTLVPGESKTYGLGNICSKWQFDMWCGQKEWGAIVESHETACNTQPSPTISLSPTPTDVPTIDRDETVQPTTTPTADSNSQSTQQTNNKTTELMLETVCNSHVSAAVVLIGDASAIKGVPVSFISGNETRNVVTDDNGKASVQFPYNHSMSVKVDVQHGFPSQAKDVKPNMDNCGTGTGGGEILSAQTEIPSTMAKTGILGNTLAIASGIFGSLIIALSFYAKKRLQH